MKDIENKPLTRGKEITRDYFTFLDKQLSGIFKVFDMFTEAKREGTHGE